MKRINIHMGLPNFRLSITLFFLVLSILSNAQKNIDQVLRKYKNDTGVLNMNFTGEILNMINKSETKLKSNIDLVDVLIFEKKTDIDKTDKETIKAVLSRDNYELLIDVKNKEQKVQLYALDGGKYLNKIYAYVNTPEMNAYFILSGKIVFEELAKLGMDFQNGDALKMLGNIGHD